MKQGKNLNKIKTIIKKLACGNALESQYKDHRNDNKRFQDCREWHIEPDWYLYIELIMMNLFYYWLNGIT